MRCLLVRPSVVLTCFQRRRDHPSDNHQVLPYWKSLNPPSTFGWTRRNQRSGKECWLGRSPSLAHLPMSGTCQLGTSKKLLLPRGPSLAAYGKVLTEAWDQFFHVLSSLTLLQRGVCACWYLGNSLVFLLCMSRGCFLTHLHEHHTQIIPSTLRRESCMETGFRLWLWPLPRLLVSLLTSPHSDGLASETNSSGQRRLWNPKHNRKHIAKSQGESGRGLQAALGDRSKEKLWGWGASAMATQGKSCKRYAVEHPC